MVAPERVEEAAVPFILGFALGIALGRSLFGSNLLGLLIGAGLFGLLLWLRDRLVAAA